MPIAMARHILVKTEVEAAQLKKRLAAGEAFDVLARKHSLCASRKRGGDLGEVRPGQMVRAIDQIIFKKPLKTIHGPVKTSSDTIWCRFSIATDSAQRVIPVRSCHSASDSSGYTSYCLSRGPACTSTQDARDPSIRCVCSGGTGKSLSIAEAKGCTSSGHSGLNSHRPLPHR